MGAGCVYTYSQIQLKVILNPIRNPIPMKWNYNESRMNLMDRLSNDSGLTKSLDSASLGTLENALAVMEHGLPSHDNLRFFNAYVASVNR